tara:strand:- start:2758 stop:3744 length:987 start_codon:yes stop_codon:yes gene_type:complete
MIISKTPYRISLFGGGTDHKEYYNKMNGLVIGGAINKYLYLSLRKLPIFFDHTFRVSWSKIENVNSIKKISHPVVRELYKFYKIREGLELHYDGDLPGNSGTGSSASFCIGLIKCLSALKKQKIINKKLYELGYLIEKYKLKESTGIQDHIFATYGGLNKIIFKRSKINISRLKISKKKIKDLEENLIIFYTKIKRSANKIEKSKNFSSTKTFNILNDIKSLAFQAEKELISTSNFNTNEIGNLLNENWKLKKRLSEKVSNYKIDEIYNEAINSGASGGKLLGAGGGGFMLFYCKKNKQKNLKKRLNKFTSLNFEFINSGSEIIENEI